MENGLLGGDSFNVFANFIASVHVPVIFGETAAGDIDTYTVIAAE